MELSDKVEISDNVVAREVSGETVLLNLETGTYFGLNAVGGRIWSLVEAQPRSLAEIGEVLLGEFDVSAETVQDDVLALAKELHEHGLLLKAD